MSYLIATFYKFVPLGDLKAKKEQILAWCQENKLKGTIIIASEGINGTIAGSHQAIAKLLSQLRSLDGLADLEHKESTAPKNPFVRLKVKIKSEIVTLGMPEINPNQQVGTYIDPQNWNQIISDPEVVVIDTRNDYEVEIGSFKRAVNPNTESFRQFPEYVAKNLDPIQHPKVAMFCTGGFVAKKLLPICLLKDLKRCITSKGAF